jgi:hypothetical protein
MTSKQICQTSNYACAVAQPYREPIAVGVLLACAIGVGLAYMLVMWWIV